MGIVNANEVKPIDPGATQFNCCAAVVSNEDYQYLASVIGCEALPMKSTQIDPLLPQCKCCSGEFNTVPNAVLRTDT